MERKELGLGGLSLLIPTVNPYGSGFFMETYHTEKFAAIGITKPFVQDNHAQSERNVIRALKFQFDAPTDKLIRVVQGEVFAVGVDIRPDSKTFGQWKGVTISAANKHQLYLPFGFAFGYCVTSDTAEVLYKLSALNNPNGGGTIRFDDPAIAIAWPTSAPIVADKDRAAPTLSEWFASDPGLRMREAINTCAA